MPHSASTTRPQTVDTNVKHGRRLHARRDRKARHALSRALAAAFASRWRHGCAAGRGRRIRSAAGGHRAARGRSLLLDLAFAGRVSSQWASATTSAFGRCGRDMDAGAGARERSLTVWFAGGRTAGPSATWKRSCAGRQPVLAAHPLEAENPQPLLDVCFADASHGVAVGLRRHLCGADGGAVWSQVPFEPELPAPRKSRRPRMRWRRKWTSGSSST